VVAWALGLTVRSVTIHPRGLLAAVTDVAEGPVSAKWVRWQEDGRARIMIAIAGCMAQGLADQRAMTSS
jgi:hypothetical protein